MQTTTSSAEQANPEVILGTGDYRYRVEPFFAKIPAGMTMKCGFAPSISWRVRARIPKAFGMLLSHVFFLKVVGVQPI